MGEGYIEGVGVGRGGVQDVLLELMSQTPVPRLYKNTLRSDSTSVQTLPRLNPLRREPHGLGLEPACLRACKAISCRSPRGGRRGEEEGR